MILAETPAHAISPAQRVLPLVAALLIVGVTVELIRRRKLREEYAMLWMFASSVLLVFAAFPQLLLLIQKHLGVFYLTIVITIGFSFLTLMLIHLGVVITRLSEGNRQLAQQLALMEQRLGQLQPHPPADTNREPGIGNHKDTKNAKPREATTGTGTDG